MKHFTKMLGVAFCMALAFVLFYAPIKAEAATTFLATWNTSAWYYSDDGGKNWYEGKDIIESKIQDG
ncbi:MAG: hypothetical protein ILP13_03790, partial [Lachnospiraceae bacterium]|nr:hypothetical protein [Lachnospiraceae bacterium]